MKNNPKIININEFLKEIFEGLAPKANEKQLNYIFAPDMIDEGKEKSLQPIFYANIDPDHFREVASNLIENAIKYTPSGDVTVDITGDDKQISISVKDSGIGIPTEDIPHLFQKFYRVDNSDTREIGGTGLGLYLSRRLAETMSGSLRVESKYKEGSTFYLEIPRVSSAEATQRLENINAESSDQADPSPTTAEDIEITTENRPEESTVEASDITSNAVSAQVSAAPSPEPQTTNPQVPKTSTEPTLAEIEEEIKRSRQQLSVPGRE